jgi:hypothetical protein
VEKIQVSLKSDKNNGYFTGQIFMKCYILVFKKTVEKIQVSLKSDKNNGYFTGQIFMKFYILVFKKNCGENSSFIKI